MNPRILPVLARVLATALAVLAPGTLAPRAAAQQPAPTPQQVSVTAEGPTRAYVGDTFGYVITVDGSSDVTPPTIPSTAEYQIEFNQALDDNSFFAQFVNGQMVSRQIVKRRLHYAVRPKSVGMLTIPPVEVTVAGAKHVTPPVRVQVTEPTAAKNAELELSIAPSSPVYAGQPVRLSLTWTLAVNIRAFQLDLPPLPDSFDLVAIPDPRPQNTPPNDTRFVTSTIGDQPVVGVISRERRGGQEFAVVRFEVVVVPHEPGEFTLGPARVDFHAVVRERPRTMMDAPWEDPAVVERQAVRSQALELKVRPLPEEGRPPDFTGLVGDYAVFADAQPRDVSVGDPIELSVRVTGPQPLSLVPPLDLTRQPLARDRAFRVPRDPLLQLPASGPGANYRASIRARSADAKQIPPIELPYFDPVAGSYKVARSQPIPLIVRPSDQVTLGGEDEDDTAETSPPSVTPDRPGGVADITREEPAWSGEPFDLVEWSARPAWAAAIAAPPLAFLGVAGFLGLRAHAPRDPAAARRRRAVTHARAALRRGLRAARSPEASVAAISSALRTCAADLTNQPAESLTTRQAIDALERHAPTRTAPAREVLEACDRVLFGTASTRADQAPEPRALAAQARAALDGLAQRGADR